MVHGWSTCWCFCCYFCLSLCLLSLICDFGLTAGAFSILYILHLAPQPLYSCDNFACVVCIYMCVCKCLVTVYHIGEHSVFFLNLTFYRFGLDGLPLYLCVIHSTILHFGWWQMSLFTDMDTFLDFDFMVGHCVLYSNIVHFDWWQVSHVGREHLIPLLIQTDMFGRSTLPYYLFNNFV